MTSLLFKYILSGCNKNTCNQYMRHCLSVNVSIFCLFFRKKKFRYCYHRGVSLSEGNLALAHSSVMLNSGIIPLSLPHTAERWHLLDDALVVWLSFCTVWFNSLILPFHIVLYYNLNYFIRLFTCTVLKVLNYNDFEFTDAWIRNCDTVIQLGWEPMGCELWIAQLFV